MYLMVGNLNQVGTLEVEIHNLNEEFDQQTRNVEARTAELQQQEALAASCAEDFNGLKARRDDLQETRK